MRPAEIEAGSSTQVEVQYFSPVDSLYCGCGILALEFHNFVARLGAVLPPISHAEPVFAQESWRGVQTIVEMASLRNSFRLRRAKCTDGGAHPPEAELQVCHDPLPFSPPASSRACLSPFRREFYPRDSNGCILFTARRPKRKFRMKRSSRRIQVKSA